jgi:glycosyltransferase involved in cell wall biosynthesis
MMDATRILFINPDFRRFAGCNVSLLGILEGLDRTRFEPVVAIPPISELGELLSARGVELFDFELNGWWYPTPAHFHRMLAGLRDRVDGLVHLIRETNIRIICTNVEYSIEGAFAAALCGVPHVWCMRPPFTHQLDILKYFPLSPSALGQAMDGLSEVIVVDCIRQLNSFPVSVPKEKLRVIEPGIDIPAELKTRAVARQELTDRLGIPAGSRIVMNVSRISPEKDLATFLHTAGSVINQYPNDVHFVHFGRPTVSAYAREIHGLVEKLGLEARFHHIDECDSIYDVMRAADVFLFTSVNYEGLVRACAEAMLSEVPVVSTRCGGPEDYVIDGQTGYLTEVADVDGLAKHVSYLLGHPEEARLMGARARLLIANKYAMNRMNKIWMELFDELVVQSKHSPFNALSLELLINILTQIGHTGASASQQAEQIRKLEGWLAPIKNNLIMRTWKSIKELAKKSK